jgi:hypothetical protein
VQLNFFFKLSGPHEFSSRNFEKELLWQTRRSQLHLIFQGVIPLTNDFLQLSLFSVNWINLKNASCKIIGAQHFGFKKKRGEG